MLSLNIGPIALPANLAILYFAFFCAWLIGCWFGYRRQQNPESALFMCLFVGVISARLFFVIQYWAQYQSQVWSIIDIRDGGFSTIAGLIGAGLCAVFYLWRKTNLRKPLSIALTCGALIGLSGLAVLNAFQSSQQLPELTLRDIQGQAVNLHDYQGKPLVINLWATWCPPCRREMPVLMKAEQHYKDVTFIYLNQGEGQQQVQQFLQQQGLSLPIVLLDSNAQAGQLIGSRTLPTTLFYTKDGQLKHSHLGELSAGSLAHALSFIRPSLKQEEIQ